VTKFLHGEIKTSDAAVAELDKALNPQVSEQVSDKTDWRLSHERGEAP